MATGDPRVTGRAADAPPEETAAGRADPSEQAEAILADSDARQEGREDSGGAVEHRRSGEDGSAQDR